MALLSKIATHMKTNFGVRHLQWNHPEDMLQFLCPPTKTNLKTCSFLEDLNTGEINTANSWTPLKAGLPVTIRRHCMVLLNSTTVLLVGGIQQGIMSSKTFFFNSQFEKWIEGPSLKFARILHNCAMIKTSGHGKKLSVVVAGGNNGTLMSSVEILDEGSREWRAGANLPQGASSGMMVADANDGVIQIGGLSANGFLNTLYHLADTNAEWIDMPQKLKQGRIMGAAFFVPNDITTCA